MTAAVTVTTILYTGGSDWSCDVSYVGNFSLLSQPLLLTLLKGSTPMNILFG